jgi:hypothetical protein
VLPVSLTVTARLVRPALSPRIDNPRKETAMNDAETIMTTYDRHRQARKEQSEGNKSAVFDALAAANITSVLVEFDGEGDGGQIESVTAVRGEEPTDISATNVTLQQVSWGNPEPVATALSLQEAIETLCYDYLEESHAGWENNDGGFGEFRLDVAKRTVALEFNGRFSDTYTENHTF